MLVPMSLKPHPGALCTRGVSSSNLYERQQNQGVGPLTGAEDPITAVSIHLKELNEQQVNHPILNNYQAINMRHRFIRGFNLLRSMP